jgi:DNA-binding NtrC family response regulator
MKFFKYFFRSKARRKTVFIVEDNRSYARSLEQFIRNNFNDVHEIKVYPVSEAAIMDLTKKPSIIIMDHYLNSKYHDAVSGLEAIREIKSKMPKVPIMLLSAQEDIGIAVEATQKYECRYVKKNELAFTKVQEYLHEIWK